MRNNELELAREHNFMKSEMERLGMFNEPEPETCNECGAKLISGSGFVGETVLYCQTHGVKWEDSEQAFANIY